MTKVTLSRNLVTFQRNFDLGATAMTSNWLTQLPNGDMINPVTGEIFKSRGQDGTFVYVPRRPKLKGWFMAFQEAFTELAKDRELWGQPTAVLHFLMGKLDFENHILIQQVEIASALNLPKTRVSEAIKKLVDKGVILKGPKVGRTTSYKLNINYGWKGKVVDFQKEQRKNFRVILGGTEDSNLEE